MKKIFIFILLLSLIFSFNVFANDMPNDVVEKYNTTTSYQYKLLVKAFNDLNGRLEYTIYGSNVEICVNSSKTSVIAANGLSNIIYSTKYSDGSFSTWVNSTGLPSKAVFISANHEILDYSSGSVFFSPPKEIFLPATSTLLIVPSVMEHSQNILVICVAIMGLMMSVTLVQRVFYRV